MSKIKKNLPKFLSVALILCMAISLFAEAPTKQASAEYLPSQAVTKLDYSVDNKTENYLDGSVVNELPSTVSDNDDISVIVEMDVDGLLDAYNADITTASSVSEYANTKAGRQALINISQEKNRLLRILKRSGLNYVLGETYETLFGGFEVTIKAKDFDKINNLLGSSSTLMLGEVYKPCETVVVENVVDVYETGIFDSSNCEYQGDGVVVAVLDTGLDYTHTAFDYSESNFTTTNEKFTLDSVSAVIDQTRAAGLTSGLTGEDVYLNRKVPFAYDYGDQDPDVLPINSEHGTHVAGIIAGKDDTITGVAPNAQLAIMKVFSDTRDGAKTSALLAALEDCVILGVDVINMSLGSGCGFTREVDEERVNVIYDKIHEQGISLIASAANSYNATFGSDKNGSNGLTSNPDSGTVGSPSTYDGPLSVASVNGVKTPYLLYGEDIIYFNEASTNDAEQKKSFVDDILKEVGDVDSYDFTYVTIPGVGEASDYAEDKSYYAGKIVLVKRGITTFEDKVRIALKVKGAAGIIIYNNVSGTISMAVGADIGAVCSISQDEGEKLAKNATGTLTVSRNNTAGPFMSDFSSWGPTSDLKIKPEITAHGGEILSAVPGQGYERLSGTSMAAPNQAGATALIRQYVTYSGVFGTERMLATKPKNYINSIVNKLMMSTADIVMNKNGLPYSVRKQGAGLVNIGNATTTASYITTYDQDGNEMDKTKLELGDDKSRTGVYEMTFGITNISEKKAGYSLDAIIMTEGVSSTYTGHDDTTVTQDGYLLEGTTLTVTKVTDGEQSGNDVIVAPGKTAIVSVKIVLSEEDKQYIADSFEYGMYVEGFITLEAFRGTEVDLNVPMLAFYGDWTEAPIFDEEYYDTNKDEINAGLDDNDKLMADAYATRVIGGLYSDYIATLGSYYFVQDPSAVQIAASKDHIALSNQQTESNWTISSIRSINAGLLRNAKEVNITITEDSTGRTVFERTEYNQRKSYSSGNTVYASSIETEFSVLEHNLKNNTQYTVTVEAYIDYGEKEEQNNVRNTFTFPLYIDFEAPVVTDVDYRTEYDKSTKKTKLYADIYVYDNHYAMGMQIGQITRAPEGSEYTFTMNSFGKYVTPVYSNFNSTSVVTVELTDYVSQIKNSAGVKYLADGTSVIVDNSNSFIVTCYDYAMNSATYELQLPDEVKSMYFEEETVKLSPNETKPLSDILNIYPSNSWIEVLDFQTSDDNVCTVVNQTLIAKQSGSAEVTAIAKDKDGNQVKTTLSVVVLAEGDEGYVGNYSVPEINKFTLTGYKTEKAYYGISSSDREIGVTGGEYDFGGDYTLKMFPSESVTLTYLLDSYFPDRTAVNFRSNYPDEVTIDENGTLTVITNEKGNASVSVYVTFDGRSTLYEQTIDIEIKDPFNITSIYLYNYKGLGGVVEIPGDRGLTTIYDYAFSNYEYVDKDVEAGDVIDDEDPYLIKQHYIGEDTVTKVIIPEGVTTINSYAFANLSALEEVVLPSTLNRIGVGAFYNCTKLNKINLENVQFINERAFYNCDLSEIDLSSVVSIGNYTFENCKLNYVALPASSQSLGIGTFYNNDNLYDVSFAAPKIKIGQYAFAECDALERIDINAAVISSYAFANCKSLYDVTIGKDVAVIGQYAFSGTNVSEFKLNKQNASYRLGNNGSIIYSGEELVLVAPQYGGEVVDGYPNVIETGATSIAVGAFSGNVKVFKVIANSVKRVANYAFAQCSNLSSVSLESATEIGDYAFFGDTNLKVSPNLSSVEKIGKYAFYATYITEVSIPENAEVGDYAFALMPKLEKVTVADGATLGEGSFFCPMYSYTYESVGSFSYYTLYKYVVKDENGNPVDGETYDYYRYNPEAGSVSVLRTVNIGNDVKIGLGAFSGNLKLTDLTFGEGVEIGDRAFYNDSALKNVDLSGVKSIGAYAFSGARMYDYWLYKSVWNYAYERQYIDGEAVITGYLYASYAPRIETLDLSNVETVGEGAFAFNDALTTVTLNQNSTSIASSVFAYCTSLETIVLPDGVSEIGDYAFMKTAITSIDLSNVETVGSYAFARSSLKEVTLNDTASKLSDGAFAYCYYLSKVDNIDAVTEIGAYAFASARFANVSLTSAVTIGDYAFKNSKLTTVTLGENLETLGENPFNGCEIKSFGRYEDFVFGSTVVESQFNETYKVSETVQVVDGVLYQTLPNGMLELVSYPASKTLTTYTVLENTARIAANAFEGASLSSVTLPYTLKAIGHKAFYGMENLSSVTFLSLIAPTLEEEYDESVLTYNNLPITGQLGSFEGIGISSYYMWNITSRYNNFYFGANFVDYVGHVQDSITLIAPSNGQYYDTFIFGQYFDNFVLGKPAMTEQTGKVIELIDQIPDSVTIKDEDVIKKARDAYDALPSTEQQSLVSNADKLTQAESIINYLKSQTNVTPTEPETPVTEGNSFLDTPYFVALMTVLGMVLGCGLAILIYVIWQKKGKVQSDD